jgi:23S rRNA A2030 N6-methylase RlmJ
MNYRHAYHAGNHADVLKHIVLVRLLEHLKKKDKPFRVFDLHAGIGVYDLTANEATKTGEWVDGVGRLYDDEGLPIPLSDQAEELIAPWRATIAAVNVPGPLRFYPGSPELAAHLLRPSDRLMLNELHPEDFANLRVTYGRDRRVTLTELDAAVAIKAQLPPPERRGLVLIDPPYETQGAEFDAILGALREINTFGLPEDYYRTFADRVRAVNESQVKVAVGEVLKPDAQVFVLIGDRAKIEEKVKALNLGPVRLLDADGRPKSPTP